jgi:hypothetical protein
MNVELESDEVALHTPVPVHNKIEYQQPPSQNIWLSWLEFGEYSAALHIQRHRCRCGRAVFACARGGRDIWCLDVGSHRIGFVFLFRYSHRHACAAPHTRRVRHSKAGNRQQENTSHPVLVTGHSWAFSSVASQEYVEVRRPHNGQTRRCRMEIGDRRIWCSVVVAELPNGNSSCSLTSFLPARNSLPLDRAVRQSGIVISCAESWCMFGEFRRRKISYREWDQIGGQMDKT